MLMLWDWHPDIEEFITVKQDLNRINGANLSLCVSDTFMEAVEKDADWPLVFPDFKDPEYDEKKAKKLLRNFVEKHPHAIMKKTEIMAKKLPALISPSFPSFFSF